MNIWQPVSIEADKLYRAQIGPLKLWLKRFEDELYIATQTNHEDSPVEVAFGLEPTKESQPENLQWARWIIGKETLIRLLPVMPDRPIVVRPEMPVNIPKSHEAVFFVSIPVWVRICAGQAEALHLCEVPTEVLSNIWYGDPMTGQLCYSLKSRARRQITDSKPLPARAICPVKVKNSASTQLDVHRFCVDLDYLNIYDGQNQTWANGVEIIFRGEEHPSDIQYSSKSPNFEGVGRLLSKARKQAKKGILQKSMVGFKYFGM